MTTLEQIGYELHQIHPQSVLQSGHAMKLLALLRAADAELARGREAEALLRRFVNGPADGRSVLQVWAEVLRWLEKHPEATP